MSQHILSDLSAAQGPNRSPKLLRLRQVRHLALDLDGTLYKGNTVFPWSVPFLRQLAEVRIGHTFLTNNSSRSAAQYLEKLAGLGMPAARDQLYTSTDSTIEFLARDYPAARRLFVLGTSGLQSDLAAAGFGMTEESAGDEPDAVIVGFDTGLEFRRLCRAAYWIARGKPFIATHPDLVCPTDEPTVLVDCGAICAALKEATGRAPDAVPGKPDPLMLAGIRRRHGLQPEQLAMVGDRLYTDVAMAHRAGAVSVLVLTGEATAEEAAAHAHGPDLVFQTLAELGTALRALHGEGADS